MQLAIHIAIWGEALLITAIAAYLKSHPHNIAGYNTMSAEQKKNVDLPGMARYIYKGMLIAAWSSVAVAYLVAYSAGDETLALYGMVIWLVAGIILVVIGAKKFDHNRKRNKLNNKQL